MLSVETFDSKSAQAVLNSFCLICIRVCLRDRRSINDSYTVCLRVRGKTRGERCRENGAWRTMQGERCREKDAGRKMQRDTDGAHGTATQQDGGVSRGRSGGGTGSA